MPHTANNALGNHQHFAERICNVIVRVLPRNTDHEFSALPQGSEWFVMKCNCTSFADRR
jgi:hypothetical protein